jgi:dienelactone hydrolase
MNRHARSLSRPLVALAFLTLVRPASAEPLPGTKPLSEEGDIASKMVAGIDKFLLRELDQSVAKRAKLWQRDLSSADAYNKSVAPNRERLAKYIGAVDPRVPFTDLELVATLRMRPAGGRIGASDDYEALRVRWPVLRGVEAEGLLLLPRGLRPQLADCIVIPDADQTPEQLAGLVDCPEHVQYAKRLAENGCRVLIPTVISRGERFSYSVGGERKLDQTHRELLYRPAFEMGRHPIGYEVQKVLAAVDWLAKQPRGGRAIGVIGYGEGGLLALYSAALDTRIDVCGVSGYFNSRQDVWQEPIYRNVWRLLHEFGDAELASLVAPRALIVETCAFPKINNVGPVREGRPNNTAAPGVLTTPDLPRVQDEFARAKELVKGLKTETWGFYPSGDDGKGEPMSGPALSAFVAALIPGADKLRPPQATPVVASKELDIEGRQKRQLDQLLEHTQALLRESEYVRESRFKINTKAQDAQKLAAYNESTKPLREEFYNEVIGNFDLPLSEPKVRTRQIYDEPKFTGYEVVMDVFPDVIAYGILLLPKDLKPGERRPVVVCQHGLEGRPRDVAHPASQKENPAYNNFAAKLAERGFITYAPQNPYIFWDRFRTLQRKANPLGKSLFSIIIPQHQQLVRWLGSLPNVDRERIAFYGLSYGGKTAMRVPAVVEEYCLSICSADFNEWVWKNASLRSRYSYVGTPEYEIFEFNLGHTFNYAEMAGLIAPRGFMVERGHRDGVAPDEAVAYEYAKIRRLYADLKIPDRTTIEFFDGPHTIHGVGTFEFLHEQLKWAKR